MRVVTLDLRGSGKSDRPNEGYDLKSYAEDIRAVVEAADLGRFAMLGLSGGVPTCIQYYANHPDQVSQMILLNGFASMVRSEDYPQGVPEETLRGALKIWQDHPEDMLKGFIQMVYSEKYTLRGEELVWQWAHLTLPEIWAKGFAVFISLNVTEHLADIDIPVLIIASENDQIVLPSASDYLHKKIPHSELKIIRDADHGCAHTWPQVGRLIKDFLIPDPRGADFEEKPADAPRILWISSPIGLGHVKRDLSIADEMRKQIPEMCIDWLAIDPVKSCLESCGEQIHPLSDALWDESGHFESRANEYALNANEAYWEMDKLLQNNFMVFHDAVRENDYDLVVGDESWEVAEYLHYNPPLKNTPFVFMSDFIGATNVSEDKAEQAHVLNVNGTWVEMREFNPEAADLSIFVGEYDDIPDIPLGEGLPNRKKWAQDYFKPSGYILTFDPAAFSDRESIRAGLGFLPEDKVLIVAVGGTSVGRPLIEKCLAAQESLKGEISSLRTLVLCGPRLDPESFSRCEDVEFKPFVSDPIKLFAACDLAIIQGGLSTAMELTALNRPFLYFPLKDHFEQQYFVPFRLNRYNAGVHMEFDTTSPKNLADAISENIKKIVNYQPVNTDGAKKAASMILDILDKGDS
jgi:pimeloyl-ACP methyl ester carboxylesterase/UDP:flavonoid glycosyltransferase YjiC (YdhE family)